MRRYLEALTNRPFAALWFGSTVSAVGDALTWVALVWLVIDTDGAAALGGLVVAYTAPVIVGGLAMGLLLDRFERRRVLIWVNALLGCAVAAVPLLSAVGELRTWHLYAVAASYGLLKMANSAAFNRSGKSVTDLRTAINRMGYNMVRSAAMSPAVMTPGLRCGRSPVCSNTARAHAAK